MYSTAYGFYVALYEAYPTPMLARNVATQALIVTGGPLAHGAGALGPVGLVLVILALPLFGIATVRAGVLPRGSGWLQIVCVPVFFLGLILLPPEVQARLPGMATPIAMQYYLLFLGYAWGGYALWTEKERLPGFYGSDGRAAVRRLTRPHDTGKPRMICCVHSLKTRTPRLVAILQKEIAMLKIWDAHNFRRTLTGLSLIAAPLPGLLGNAPRP